MVLVLRSHQQLMDGRTERTSQECARGALLVQGRGYTCHNAASGRVRGSLEGRGQLETDVEVSKHREAP